MRIINGNILDVTRGIIVHQVNCRRVMGAGLALQIRRKYPRHYADFISRIPHLGGLVITQVNTNLYVVGVYSQDGYGGTACQTNYAALQKGLAAVQKMACELGLPVYIPFKIGCGLAHGDWTIVQSIISKTVPAATIIRKR